MRHIYLLIMMLCAHCLADAQDYMFKRLEVTDGLPNNQVNAICKDSEGYIWMGTTGGLARYDGYTFRIFRHLTEDSLSLPDNYVDRIVEDGEGRLWLHTGAGYTWYDRRTETFCPHVENQLREWGVNGSLQMVMTDSRGDLWLGLYGLGGYRLPKGDSHVQAVKTAADEVPMSNVTAMAECREGILMAYANGLVECIDPATMCVRWRLERVMEETRGRGEEFVSLFVDRDEDLWIYSYHGVWVYNVRDKEWREWGSVVDGKRENPHDMVRSMTQDALGRLWIGKDQGGVMVLDKSTMRRTKLTYHSSDGRSLPNNTIATLYTDNEGTVWVGTYKKGVAYYNESIYKFGLRPLGDINCIAEDTNGSLWLGTNDSGLLHYNPTTGQTRSYNDPKGASPTANAIVCLLQSREGKLWIGSFMGGLDCYDGYTFRHYRHQVGNDNSLADNNVWALAEDSEGHVWIGTLGAGIQCLDPKTGRFTSWRGREAGLPSDYITSFSLMEGNRLLVATTEGLAIMDLDNRRMAPLKGADGKALRMGYINQAMVDSRGLVWVATRDGLSYYDLRDSSRHDVLPRESINERFMAGVAEDLQGTIWATTSSGVVNIRVEHDGEGYVCRCRRYDTKDGLQGSEFNQRSIKCLSWGTVVMGGLYGLNVFNPATIRYNQTVPKVHFTSFLLFNEEVQVGQKYDGRVVLPRALGCVDEVRLDYRQNIFSVLFATDNFILPDKTTYLYQLEGFSEEWMTATADMHRVTYTNLTPGTYTLKVKAVGSDGVEGTQVARLRIVICPPWWLTSWAYGGYFLLLVAAAAGAWYGVHRRERNRFRIRQLEEDAKKTEELNQMKFRFFTNVSHELRSPLTLIISPLESLMAQEVDGHKKERLGMIHRNALRLLQLVNQLLDFRKLEMAGMSVSLSEGDLVAFARSVCSSFLLLAEKKDVELRFVPKVEKLDMAFDEDKMGKVLTNLLSNAFKFTPEGGVVEVQIQQPEQDDGIVLLRVTDTGIGIKDEDKEHVFDRFFQVHDTGLDNPSTGSGIGLSLVRDFVALHQGSIRVSDNVEAGRGTVFQIELPIGHLGTMQPQEEQKEGEEENLPAKETPEEEPEQALTAEVEEAIPEETEPEKESGTRRTPRKPLALIVDDNEDLVEFMRDTLSIYFRVETAPNGRLAWQRIPDMSPDIIVSDVMMPEMDGNELCRWVKSDKRTSHIPLILLTAKSAIEDKVESLTIGADDYVTKPFNVEVLVLRMRKLIELSRRNNRNSGLIDPEPSVIKVTSMDEKLVAKAIKYIEDNISRSDLSVEELSQALGMSRVHLYKKLMQITGKKPIEFIRIIRLKRAAQLLRESQQNVSEIAYQLGFNNPKYFSKYFKDEFGVLPSVYQDEHEK